MLMKAIEESCIAIVVYSKNYASSRWCLKELVKIMECKEQKNLTVLPMFYKVDPKEVRGSRKSYQRALAKHEFNLRKDLEKVKRWRKALFDAGNLSGWHLNDGDESEHIQNIVKKISTDLDRIPLHVAEHLVGIESRVIKLKSMLNLESQGSCFLEHVRETSKACRGLVTLQESLLNDILLPQQILKVSNVDGGINLIQHRLRRKRVLLILDDVDDLHQLHALAGEGKWFGNGSRVIVTTTDIHLLTYLGIDQDHVYEVRALNYSEANELLSKHAFSTHQKSKIKTNLVDSVLNHAKGLPLALEVLGSFLCSRRESEWESTLDKISTAPNKYINAMLKISYEGLEANEKEIFLHIT
ncbi:TMV resistance protein N-like [Rutidosis leptorrhynchoides]|uniref:TMV resistance protein N-like n=1 Tax=Rutidosis leptorrhynchoides TaxID=125765 RepID=UPI003A9952A6